MGYGLETNFKLKIFSFLSTVPFHPGEWLLSLKISYNHSSSYPPKCHHFSEDTYYLAKGGSLLILRIVWVTMPQQRYQRFLCLHMIKFCSTVLKLCLPLKHMCSKSVETQTFSCSRFWVAFQILHLHFNGPSFRIVFISFSVPMCLQQLVCLFT